jgi:hypothetical protein
MIMRKNIVKINGNDLKHIIRESVKNYINEELDNDLGDFYEDYDDEDYEWDGSWNGVYRSEEDYAEDPSSEEMIWRHYGNQNIHPKKFGAEGMESILAQGDKNTWARKMARSVRPTNAEFENELYKDWGDGPETDTEEDMAYIHNKLKQMNEAKITKMVYESVKRKLRNMK